MLGIFGHNIAGLFILVWLIGWTVGGIFAIRFYIWNLIGKEIISAGQGQLTIAKKGLLFSKPKTYDVNQVTNIRVLEENNNYGNFFGARSNNFAGLNSMGTIRFDYGLQTVKFAAGLDEAEGRHILQKLKESHFLSDKNFSTTTT